MVIVTSATAVIGLIAAYATAPLWMQIATKADVQVVAEELDNERVCRLRADNRRLQIDLREAEDPDYRMLLKDQIEANNRALEELAKDGARCVG